MVNGELCVGDDLRDESVQAKVRRCTDMSAVLLESNC